MPVPTAITELSQTAGSNSPSGSESPITTDNYLRQLAAFLAMLRDGVGFATPISLASAATTDIGAQNSMVVQISGSTTITSFGTNYGGPRFLRFSGAMTLTHNSTVLRLPGAANITTVAGDSAIVVPNLSGGGWNMTNFTRGSALAALSGANTDITSLSAPALGAATATTQSAGDNTTKVATTAFVTAATPAASATVSGLVELATTAETETGTDATRAVTPAGLKGALGVSNYFESGAQTPLTAASLLTIAHGLGAKPVFMSAFLTCITAEHGYSIADEVHINVAGDAGSASYQNAVYVDATNIYVRLGASGMLIGNKTTGAGVVLTAASWSLTVRAWA